MKIIDLNNWERATHFNFFRGAAYSQYNICMNIDITHFLKVIKQNNLSFYYSMIFAATKVLNEVEELRYRIQDGDVVLHDRISPSFTDMSNDTDLFKMVTVDLNDDITEFVSLAKRISESQKEYFVPAGGRTDLIYITCIPWISFTHISHTMTSNKDDAVPRISWGKYFTDGDKILLPYSVQVHHSFVDGIHIGKYIEKLQAYLDEFELNTNK